MIKEFNRPAPRKPCGINPALVMAVYPHGERKIEKRVAIDHPKETFVEDETRTGIMLANGAVFDVQESYAQVIKKLNG